MGFFSWRTSDTDRSICNIYSDTPTFGVAMITEDGRVWFEDAYEGYGEFGGKDIYELIAELNGLNSDRSAGIDLVFKDNPSGEFDVAAAKGIKLPKLVENQGLAEFKDLPYPVICENQGYFYSDEDEDY